MLFTFLRPFFIHHWRQSTSKVVRYGAIILALAVVRKILLKIQHRRQQEMIASLIGCPKRSPSLHNLIHSRVSPEKDFKFWLSHEKASNDPDRKFRILSLDGGGVRGVYTATLLIRLTQKFPNLLDNIDLIAGSSTGGLLALLLAGGYNPEQCREFYMRVCPGIFYQNWWRRINPFSAMFTDRHRAKIFKALGQGLKFKDLTKFVVITGFRLDDGSKDESMRQGATHFTSRGSWRPALFTNLPKHKGKVDPDLELLLSDAAMRTTAAPTYFPTYQQYCDGAVFANNPSLCAMSVALGNYPDVLTTQNVVCLSIGSGLVKRAVPFDGDNALTPMHHKGRHDWGPIGWARWIIDMLMDGSQYLTEDVMNMMLGSRFFYLNDTLSQEVDLSDVTKMGACVEMAEQVDIEPCIKFIKQNFYTTKPQSMSGSKSHSHLQKMAEHGPNSD